MPSPVLADTPTEPGFRATSSQAAALTERSDNPVGPLRHFSGAVTTMSKPHSSVRTSRPPTLATASTRDTTPAARHSRPISAMGATVPQGVSTWTTLSSSASGFAASPAPTANAATITLSTSMPIRRAVSGSCEVATMARPVFERFTKNQRKTVLMASAPMVNTAGIWMVTPPI